MVVLVATLSIGGIAGAQQAPGTNPGAAAGKQQTNSDGRVVTNQTVTVSAGFTPEKMYGDKISRAEQPAYAAKFAGDCAKAIELYKSDVIPLAEQSKYPKVKAKFLFGVYGVIGECQQNQGRYIDAEQSYRKQAECGETWPGKEDSAYPLVFFPLGVVQMGREHWKDAEGNFEKVKAELPARIERAEKSNLEDEKNTVAPSLPLAEVTTLVELAVVYSREVRVNDALAAVDQSYLKAVTAKAPPDMMKTVVGVGQGIAGRSGDAAAIAKWAERPEK